MNTFIFKMIDRCAAVAGAFIFCQVPAFMQQYTHILFGHVQECKRLHATLEVHASLGNKSVSEYIKKFLTQQDPDFVQQGKMLLGIQERYNELTVTYANLTGAPIWKKPFVFFSSLDMAIVEETFSKFVVSLTLSVETAIFAFMGIVVAMGLLRLVYWCCRFLFGRKRGLKAP